MRNVRAAVVGIGAFALLGGFVVGVPICLVRMIGNPFPASIPTWSSLVDVVVDGTLPSGVLERVLAAVVWVWWSQVALSFLAELVAACRGRTSRPLPLGAFGMQSVVVRLVALVLAAAGSFAALVHPVIAATPSFADVALPMATRGPVHEARAGVFVGPPSGSVPAVGEVPAPVLSPPLQVPSGSHLPAVGKPPAPVLSPPPRAVTDFSPAAASEVPVPVLDPSTAQAGADPVPAGEPVAEPSGESRAAPGEIHAVPIPDSPATRADPAVPAPPALGESGWVVVRPGDSLWHLAEEHLGDAMRWGEIYELNSGPLPGGGTLRDPNLIHPGWRLRLPTVERSAVPGPAVQDSAAASLLPSPSPAASPS